MAKAVTLHPDVYNLLITNKMDDFTVSEIRDALVYSSEHFNEENEARRYIYRIICKLVKRGLLIKHPNSQIKKTKYKKSELFTKTQFLVKSDIKFSKLEEEQTTELNSVDLASNADIFAELLVKKQKHQAELAIKLGEVEEFKALMKRYPQKNELFNPLYLETREHSAQLLGKVNALTKVLNTTDLAA